MAFKCGFNVNPKIKKIKTLQKLHHIRFCVGIIIIIVYTGENIKNDYIFSKLV